MLHTEAVRESGRTRRSASVLTEQELELRKQARQAVQRALRSGALVRGLCEGCESAETDAHHEDYEQPLQVRWLCRAHHKVAHGAVNVSRQHKPFGRPTIGERAMTSTERVQKHRQRKAAS